MRGAGGGGGDAGTHEFGGDAHGVEFLFIVGAGLGAVVCDEDEAFASGGGAESALSAWVGPSRPMAARAERIRCLPLLRSISRVSTVPSNTWSPDHRTPALLLVSSASGHCGASCTNGALG